mgnify:FL=1
MTPKQQVKQLIKKLKTPYWTPLPTSRYLTNWQGNIAYFNLYYVLRGRPSSSHAGDIARNIDYWRCSKAVNKIETPFGQLSDSVVVLTPEEFWHQVIKVHPTLFTRLLPLKDWQRLTNEATFDSKPARIHTSLPFSD